MPELPEVETIKEDLKEKIVGRTITGGWTDWPKMIKQPPADQFFQEIKSAVITDTTRRAKNLIVHLNNGLNLIFHLKMTGHFLIAPKELLDGNNWKTSDELLSDRVNQFIHFALFLDDGRVVAMSDMRKFGWVRLVNNEQLQEILSKYGPEPLEDGFTFEKWREILSKKTGIIKKLLLDQTVIAGIGNIYADEILFRSGVLPGRDVKNLTDEESKEIFKAIKEVLKQAVKLRGTSTSDYRDTSGKKGAFAEVRAVYRRTGEPCPVCGLPVERKKMAGRSSHYCRVCQK